MVGQKGKVMATTTGVKQGFPEEGTANRALLPVPEVVSGGAGTGPPPRPRRRLHSRPLQQLLLLTVGLHRLLRHQLHQLQTLLDLHQDLKVLPAPDLSREADPLPSRARAPPLPRPLAGASGDPGLAAL